jgi:hypothetical protein
LLESDVNKAELKSALICGFVVSGM